MLSASKEPSSAEVPWKLIEQYRPKGGSATQRPRRGRVRMGKIRLRNKVKQWNFSQTLSEQPHPQCKDF